MRFQLCLDPLPYTTLSILVYPWSLVMNSISLVRHHLLACLLQLGTWFSEDRAGAYIVPRQRQLLYQQMHDPARIKTLKPFSVPAIRMLTNAAEGKNVGTGLFIYKWAMHGQCYVLSRDKGPQLDWVWASGNRKWLNLLTKFAFKPVGRWSQSFKHNVNDNDFPRSNLISDNSPRLWSKSSAPTYHSLGP